MTEATANPSHEHHDEEHEHVSSIPLLLGVYVLLLFFTFLTVAVTWPQTRSPVRMPFAST